MLKLRDAMPSDFEAIIKLHLSGLAETSSLSLDESLDQDLYNIESFYDGIDKKLVVAHNEDNEIIGMGAIIKLDNSKCEIKRMRVHSHSRRIGVAQFILDELFAHALLILQVYEVFLDTSVTQIAAQRLYEKNGFSIVEHTTIGGIPSIIYQKKLSI